MIDIYEIVAAVNAEYGHKFDGHELVCIPSYTLGYINKDGRFVFNGAYRLDQLIKLTGRTKIMSVCEASIGFYIKERTSNNLIHLTRYMSSFKRIRSRMRRAFINVALNKCPDNKVLFPEHYRQTICGQKKNVYFNTDKGKYHEEVFKEKAIELCPLTVQNIEVINTYYPSSFNGMNVNEFAFKRFEEHNVHIPQDSKRFTLF